MAPFDRPVSSMNQTSSGDPNAPKPTSAKLTAGPAIELALSAIGPSHRKGPFVEHRTAQRVLRQGVSGDLCESGKSLMARRTRWVAPVA